MGRGVKLMTPVIGWFIFLMVSSANALPSAEDYWCNLKCGYGTSCDEPCALTEGELNELEKEGIFCRDPNQNPCMTTCGFYAPTSCTRPPNPDEDYDTIPNEEDNCPKVWNKCQEDCDGDEIGDKCDDFNGTKKLIKSEKVYSWKYIKTQSCPPYNCKLYEEWSTVINTYQYVFCSTKCDSRCYCLGGPDIIYTGKESGSSQKTGKCKAERYNRLGQLVDTIEYQCNKPPIVR